MIPDLSVLAALTGVFVISAVASHWLASRTAMMDHPNERSLHGAAVPRSGGLAILLGITLPLAYILVFEAADPTLAWVAISALSVAAVSLWDDLGHVSVRGRLAVHSLAVACLIQGGLEWNTLDLPGFQWSFPLGLAWMLTWLFGVWMINLFNFMDGMDGFAGGMAAIGFGALAVLGWRGDAPTYSFLAASIAAAAAGFLTSNYPPARIFLGDVGASTLGLLAAALSLWGSELGLFPLWVAWLAFSPFIVDATSTLLRRLASGERIWQAHRSHYYQRLVLAGWGHRRTVLRAYVVMAGAALCAVGAPGLSQGEQRALIAAWAVIYLVIAWRVGIAERIAAQEAP